MEQIFKIAYSYSALECVYLQRNFIEQVSVHMALQFIYNLEVFLQCSTFSDGQSAATVKQLLALMTRRAL